jgi:hypothetical protein
MIGDGSGDRTFERPIAPFSNAVREGRFSAARAMPLSAPDALQH